MKTYYVYIATNRNRTLYTGVTNNLQRRHLEQAISREKQIKGWRRSKKVALIEAANPNWMEGGSPWLP